MRLMKSKVRAETFAMVAGGREGSQRATTKFS